jgi:flavin reductase (DIM6/NTAB) family NADH-FMN oxidoreductase RutF
MEKMKMGAKTLLYPMPIVIMGANVEGKVNYMSAAWCSIVEENPPMIMVASNKSHHTNRGIKENGTFSINIPSEEMVISTDYVGIRSGKNTDKSTVFDNFYGELLTAPMIDQCPINLECRLIKTIDLDTSHEIFIGKIEETYVNNNCITNTFPDIKKIKPIVFSNGDANYWSVGELLGKAFRIGKEHKTKV